MSIRTILNTVLVGLAVMAIAAMGLIANHSWTQWRQTVRMTDERRVSDLLLSAASQWAVERGLTNGALGADAVIGAEAMKAIQGRRTAGDQAFSDALALMPAMDFPTRAALQADVDRHHQTVLALRQQVDQALTQAKSLRPPQIAVDWFPSTSRQITAALELRRAMVVANVHIPELIQAEDLRTQLAIMSEYAGRERGYINGVIAAGRAMNSRDIEIIGEFRGRILGAWESARTLGRDDTLSAPVGAALTTIGTNYFTQFETIRQSVLDAGKAGTAYPITAQDWFKSASAAMDSIIAAQQTATEASALVLADQAASTLRSWLIAAAFTGFSVLLLLLGWLVVTRRVTRPLVQLEATMDKLAAGDLTAQVSATGQKDEMGAMARSVLVFRDAMKDAQILRGEQEALRLKQAQERRQALLEMADLLDGNVGNVVSEIAGAASQLSAHATSLSGLAQQTGAQTSAAAGASQEASVNVQSVASATEELSASIGEISRQVTESASEAQHAVAELDHTTRTMESLQETVARVDEVTRMISAIAAQTNMLALNATIEAARAGEAGKGFAVVAGEVKNLANQTAKATQEITVQIQGIESITTQAANALSDVNTTIDRIHASTSAIAAAVEQQGAATSEISRSIQQAAMGAKVASDNVDGLASAADETQGQANQVRAASASLTEQAGTLRTALTDFLSGLRAG